MKLREEISSEVRSIEKELSAQCGATTIEIAERLPTRTRSGTQPAHPDVQNRVISTKAVGRMGSELNVSAVRCRRSRNEVNESTETSGECAPSTRSDD